MAAQGVKMSKTIIHGTVLQNSGISSYEEINLLDVDYADDMALLDNSKDGLQETTDLLCKYATQAGLRINMKKTDVIAIDSNNSS